MNDTSDLIPENETNWQNDWQIPYFDNLTERTAKGDHRLHPSAFAPDFCIGAQIR